MNIESSSQIYDLVAYSGYKFVGVIVTIAVSALWNKGVGTGGWVGWGVFGYAFLSNAFFLVSFSSFSFFFFFFTFCSEARNVEWRDREVREGSSRWRAWQSFLSPPLPSSPPTSIHWLSLRNRRIRGSKCPAPSLPPSLLPHYPIPKHSANHLSSPCPAPKPQIRPPPPRQPHAEPHRPRPARPSHPVFVRL